MVDLSNIETLRIVIRLRFEEDCIVYIEEDGAYVPYLVLTSDYGGNVFVIEKN